LSASATPQAGGPVATGERCSGEQAFVEVAVEGRANSFTRNCLSNADPVGRLATRLSVLAGSRDHEQLDAAAIEEVLATDRAFAALAASDGVPAAFAHYAAHDALMVRGSSENTVGHDAVVARFANWPEGATLEWTPRAARVSSRGDMAWSWGDSVFVAADGTRTPGRYVSIWSRDVEGEWRFAVDVGAD
jgi:ketosteroid isomerase-like protein